MSTLTKEKKVNAQHLAHIDQWLQEAIQLRSCVFQVSIPPRSMVLSSRYLSLHGAWSCVPGIYPSTQHSLVFQVSIPPPEHSLVFQVSTCDHCFLGPCSGTTHLFQNHRSSLFVCDLQLLKVAFDEEVNSDEIEGLRKLLIKLRNPSSVAHTFAFAHSHVLLQSHQLHIKVKEKNATLKSVLLLCTLRCSTLDALIHACHPPCTETIC